MKKGLLIFAIVFANSILATASHIVSPNQALNYVMQHTHGSQKNNSRKIANHSKTFTIDSISINGDALLYVVSHAEGGWFLIPSDDRVCPILAHSENGTFSLTNIPLEVREILIQYEEGISYVRGEGNTSPIHPDWNPAQNDSIISNGGLSAEHILPIIGELKWDQGEANDATCINAYNMFCPTFYDVACGHTKAGCVAIALGQLMKYWQWPRCAFVPDSITPEKDITPFGTHLQEYNWEIMPNSLYQTTPTNEAKMLATLLRDIGYSANMRYGERGSGAGTGDIFNALSRFQYKIGQFINTNNEALHWSSELLLLKNEINQGRPAIICGYDVANKVGHCFLVYGYTANKVYINWGHAGVWDGAFSLTNLIYNTDYNFSSEHQIFLGIEPEINCTETIVQAIQNEDVISSASPIEIQVSIEPMQKVIVQSASAIRLLPGFQAKKNSCVHLTIENIECLQNNTLNNRQIARHDLAAMPIANKWKMLSYNIDDSQHWHEWTAQLNGDTVINNETYQMVVGDGFIEPCLIRYSTDMMQLYIYNKTDKEEYLLCDFTKQPGERMEIYEGIGFFMNEESVEPWRVQSNEVIENRHYIVLAKENSSIEETVCFVQGVGSPYLFFSTANERYCYGCLPIYSLCAFHDDEQIYSFDLSHRGIVNNCTDWEYVPSALESAPAEPSARLILRDGHILVEREDELFNLTGQRVE